MGRDAAFMAVAVYLTVFQSTRPHGARRTYSSGVGSNPYVSIHAPAWGATGLEIYASKDYDVSIHAPAWGAT